MTAAKSIQIILARQLASSIATPILLVDEQNALIYYNEPAEQIFNRPQHAYTQALMAAAFNLEAVETGVVKT